MTIKIPNTRLASVSDIVFRPLTSADFGAYKDLRMQALSSEDRRFFVEGKKPETLRTDDEWRSVCTETFDDNRNGLTVAIGAFYNSDQGQVLVGSALTERWDEDTSNKTAYYRAIYVHPNFRTSGVAEKIELLQDRWARKNGYSKAIFTVRADKKKWLERQIKVFGGRIFRTSKLPYANGEKAETHFIKRTLVPALKLPNRRTRKTQNLAAIPCQPAAIAA